MRFLSARLSLLYTSLQASFCLPIFQCRHILIATLSSTHVHLLITTSSSVCLSTCPNHLSLASMIFSLMFATSGLAVISSALIVTILVISIIPLNIHTLEIK